MVGNRARCRKRCRHGQESLGEGLGLPFGLCLLHWGGWHPPTAQRPERRLDSLDGESLIHVLVEALQPLGACGAPKQFLRLIELELHGAGERERKGGRARAGISGTERE